MRQIEYIVVHCTATLQSATVEAIKRYWRETLGWKKPGYHYIIDKAGHEHILLDESEVANGVKGYNHNSIHISYIGGVDKAGRPIDNRTQAQKDKIINKLYVLKTKYPKARIQGHRDFPSVKKACPSFDVRAWLRDKGLTKLL